MPAHSVAPQEEEEEVWANGSVGKKGGRHNLTPVLSGPARVRRSVMSSVAFAPRNKTSLYVGKTVKEQETALRAYQDAKSKAAKA
eukprot:scaffold133283_cov73-Phaeocystis_antarctica.AAC.3